MRDRVNIFRVDGVSLFRDEPVKREDLRCLLSAATAAPSAANAQPWEFIVLETDEGKGRVFHTLRDQRGQPVEESKDRGGSWLLSAPLVLVAALDTMRAKAKTGPAGSDVFGLIDLGAAVQNLLIRARMLGIGGTIIREFDAGELRRVLEMPSHIRPLIICVLGYSDQEPLQRPYLGVEDIAHHETWNNSLDG